MKQLALDLLGLAGLGMFVAGVWQAYAPLGWMVGGLLLAGVCWIASAPREKPQ